MNILVDMNLPESWVPFLSEQGHKVTYWSSVGSGDALDSQLIEWAVVHDHVILTHDLDFGILHSQRGASWPSLIQVRLEKVTPSLIGAAVAMAIANHVPQLTTGCI